MVLLAIASGTIFVSVIARSDDRVVIGPVYPFSNQIDGKDAQLDNTNYVITIAAAAGKTNFTIGEWIDIRIALKNVGTNQVILANTFPLSGFHAYVTCTNGLPVPLTQFGQDMWGPTASVAFSFLDPGQSFTTTSPVLDFSRASNERLTLGSDYPLDLMYNLGSPGIYHVTVSRYLGDVPHKKPILATSNVLQISIK